MGDSMNEGGDARQFRGQKFWGVEGEQVLVARSTRRAFRFFIFGLVPPSKVGEFIILFSPMKTLAAAVADLIALLVLAALTVVPSNKNHLVKQPTVCFFQPFKTRLS
jgi:hypothetical protein